MAKEKMTPQEVADDLGIPVQAVRIRLVKGIYPFGDAIESKNGTGIHNYKIYRCRYELWKQGKL